MSRFALFGQTAKRRFSLSLCVLSIGIPLWYLVVIPGCYRWHQENHRLPFNQSGFDHVIEEIRTGSLKPAGDGRIILPPDQSPLTNDGCVYITQRGSSRLVFFPTEPWDWTFPSAHFYTGYVFNDAETVSLNGEELIIHCPEGTPSDPFELSKYRKPHWYHASLVD